MPLIRRIPKRGFTNGRHRIDFLPVNVKELNRFEAGTRVDEAALRSSGLATGPADGIKILGTGELKPKLIVIANAFSASAKAKIEAAGGSCELVAKKTPAKTAKA